MYYWGPGHGCICLGANKKSNPPKHPKSGLKKLSIVGFFNKFKPVFQLKKALTLPLTINLLPLLTNSEDLPMIWELSYYYI